MNMLIYKITNLINDKIYIGLTTTGLKKRISSYKSVVKHHKTTNQFIIKAMRKYGFQNFKFEIVDIANSKIELKEKEIFYISKLNSNHPNIGYNMDHGGFLRSQETLDKVSEKLKNKPLTEVHKKKISEGLKNHIVSEETRQKQSIAKKGKSPWNKGKVGVMKTNTGSFATGKPAPNKGRKKIIVDGRIKYIKDST